ncbi:MAG: hypothetical protein ABIK07_17630 [Planctomycetota bacterium]|jgi:hypothetical protein|uniref:hypothetical protein n=1 Tax=uncultured Gimesia sp. TaxID=1678688 RepID=UPI002613B4C4|nr:hypothetical protein [uncultured Gimesia sp.]
MFYVSGYFRCALVFCALTLTGCFGGSAEHIERAAVSGTVTFDGKPLPEGSIQFVPDVDSTGKPVRGKAVQALISDGKYTLEADQGPTVGPNKILINATQKTGKFQDFDGKKTEILKQYIPEKFNSDSTLKFDVKAGPNTADFSLESK